MSIEKKVIDIVHQVMEIAIEKVSMESTSDTIEEWDSLHHINLVLALEEEFNVRFTPEQISQLVTVKEIVKILDTISKR